MFFPPLMYITDIESKAVSQQSGSFNCSTSEWEHQWKTEAVLEAETLQLCGVAIKELGLWKATTLIPLQRFFGPCGHREWNLLAPLWMCWHNPQGATKTSLFPGYNDRQWQKRGKARESMSNCHKRWPYPSHSPERRKHKRETSPAFLDSLFSQVRPPYSEW